MTVAVFLQLGKPSRTAKSWTGGRGNDTRKGSPDQHWADHLRRAAPTTLRTLSGRRSRRPHAVLPNRLGVVPTVRGNSAPSSMASSARLNLAHFP